MRVFKFGGASVKDALGVQNTLRVLKHEGVQNTLVVVSAMGKMTNAFEKLVATYTIPEKEIDAAYAFILDYHLKIVSELFEKEAAVFSEIEGLFDQLKSFLETNNSTDYNFIYDQVVCYGELLATKIISAFLAKNGIENQWIDIRTIIKTDQDYRNANVNWEATKQNCSSKIDTSQLCITQGFISADETNNTTTTLGREGSDFTAGILAYCLDAESVTIWKDVVGVLNADPRQFIDPILLEEISYQEAIEMAFYGASVIHPKTLKPLENKKIPLWVRSFELLETRGTKVSKGVSILPKTPCYIVKTNQTLVSISANDFSFMVEENISDLFNYFHKYSLKVNLIQNSALSFSVCLEDTFDNFTAFHKELQPKFKIKYNHNVSLYTIRHFDQKSLESIEQKGTVLLKQISRETAQLVI
ncbi:aspartokinase [Polaribacter pacificus]|uniref:Aspartokinase n=1 Tax=Polaribacter pacificus TaxID=1775173 RepID=A0A917HWT2_9FLAO|nr:aspartate kinase [Polaribacter pacificus]GGG92688.1 aspartokinase [Polaribacter pacificus]